MKVEIYFESKTMDLKKPINVLSLFDGMSCGRLALERAGIPVNTYYASEIDKHAIAVSHNNYSDIVRLGNVELWRDWDIDWGSIDLVMGGSPCQGFSFAGKQLAFDDPRSKLFFVFVDILNHIKSVNPDVKFLLENVRMKKEFLNVISNALGVEPVMINSALVSAQNRVRYYWANWEFGQPEDKGIVLRDVLEFDCDVIRNKSKTLRVGGGGSLPHTKQEWDNVVYKTPKVLHILDNQRVEGISETETSIRPYRGDRHKSGISEIGTIAKDNGKSATITATHAPSVSLYPASIVGRRLNERGVRDDYNKDVPITQCLEVNNKINSRCLTTVEKDTMVSTLPPGRYPEAYSEELKLYYRKLTIRECERLQTVPDGYTHGVSVSQARRMLGNGWTVDVIAHIFNGLKYSQEFEHYI